MQEQRAAGGKSMSQVWLITGSSRGLGRAFAEAALAAGCQVAATARRAEDLAELKNKYGDLVLPLVLDVTNETQARQAVQATIRTFGKLDVLVNNAGYGNVAPIEDTTLEDFRAQIETNLFGVIILTKAALPYFRERVQATSSRSLPSQVASDPLDAHRMQPLNGAWRAFPKRWRKK